MREIGTLLIPLSASAAFAFLWRAWCVFLKKRKDLSQRFFEIDKGFLKSLSPLSV